MNRVAPSRLQLMDELVRELSYQDDADRLIRVFAQRSELLYPRDGMVTLSRLGLEPPAYRITRSWRWTVRINPWTEMHRLPVFDRGLLGDLLHAGRPVLLSPLRVASDDPARKHLEGMHSLAAAPGYDRGRAINMVVALCHRADGFDTHDLETMLLNANLLSRAASNLKLAQELQEAYHRLDVEMEQVGRMQQHLLPASLPRIDGLDLAASYVTCNRAGGDYYDVLPLPDGRWGFFVADVSGHGTPAAVVMAMMHTLLHAYPGPPEPPAAVFAHMNHHLLTVAPEGMFATAFYGVYDPGSRRLVFANAGHPPGRLRRGGEVTPLEAPRGLPLGIERQETWAEHETQLARGDVLLLFTDGFPEGMNGAGKPFGFPRLEETLRMGPLRAGPLVRHIERVFRDFCGNAPDLDDRTLLALVGVP